MKRKAHLVTGASNGIGQAIAHALLDQGHAVVSLDYRAPTDPREGFVSIVTDLTDVKATREAAAQVCAEYDILGLVNNAGATRPGTVEGASVEDLDYVVALNLRAAMLLTQAVVPAMRAHGFGRIVNMASRAALGKEERLVYSATKAGLIGMTRTMALELGAYGVTANAIAPGPIATELFTTSNDEEQTRRIVNSTLVKRIGTPEDVARAAMFFLSPENGFVTGQVLYVCGGVTVGKAPN